MKHSIQLAALCLIALSAFSIAMPNQQGTPTKAQAMAITDAYLAGISGGDLDELDKLFVDGDASSIFENASDEGSWGHYKEHHLAPEQESVKDFQFSSDEKEAQKCGSGFLVRHVGGFSLEAGGRTRLYQAAVSFSLTPTKKGLKILHLHWSSREAR